ncbi:protein diaphanous homolog 2 [Tetranychus urticae]|uniref:Uncharacterized protein n=1 Tax=Tetranychus urticae TaxID=32264 RepID=T1KUN5_TETUR|nr:protein diaphanous homolog 2 [Tetranychus urticae]
MRLLAILILALVAYSVSGATLASQNKLANGATKNNSGANSVSQVTDEIENETSTAITVEETESEKIERLLKEIQELLANVTANQEPRPPVKPVLPPMVLPKPPCHKPIPPFNLPRPPFGLPRPPFGLPRPPFQPAPFYGPRPFSGFGSQGVVTHHEHFGGRFGNNQRFGFRQNW